MLSGLNLSTDFGRIQEILKSPQRPTSFDTILMSSFIMPPPSLPAKEKAFTDTYSAMKKFIRLNSRFASSALLK